ncbi:hypothetical protein TrCOL_g10180 [Triparma columacea]|uniref:Uncharacterized protein n=1 Tax=Triparma columacea TaxID=722753 RepID=A0A9W7FVT1_9STRA|nr:hypothetical protein TrCOL_g10180 [Triparma columacea]
MFLHSLIRLVVMPGVVISIENLLVRVGVVDSSERLIRLIISVEAAAPSAQMMIVSLNQLGVQDMAGALAYAYIPHYIMSIFTITGWATLAGWIIYGEVD